MAADLCLAVQLLGLSNRSSVASSLHGRQHSNPVGSPRTDDLGDRECTRARHRKGSAGTGDEERLDSGLFQQVSMSKVPFVLWKGKAYLIYDRTYAMVHIPATISYIGYSYWAFPPAVFQRVRRTLVLCNCLAFIIFSSWPCMPPRLLPFEEFGYIDTVHRGEAASSESSRLLGVRDKSDIVRFRSLDDKQGEF